MEAITKENTRNGQQRMQAKPKFGRLSSACETPRAKNVKQFTFDQMPSLEACSMESCESRSPNSLGSPKTTTVSFKPRSQPVPAPPSKLNNEGCLSDRFVRFFCPFDVILESSTHSSNKNVEKDSIANKTSHNVQTGSFTATCPPGQNCTDAWTPDKICIPQQWDASPERRTSESRLRAIHNRASTLDEKQRKSEYIDQIRKQWHSREAALPLKLSKSEAATKNSHKKPLSYIRMPSAPAAYYDSDPDMAPVTPRFKRNRPMSLNLDVHADSDSEINCPRVSRHSVQRLSSFFDSDSPRSILETPDLNNDAAVRQFIRHATEQRVSMIWHQAPQRDHDGRSTKLLPPKSITGWFESGSQLDNIVVFPKFAWRQAFQAGTSLISRTPYSIQLLTIVSVVAPASLDRKLYPFARLDRTCCIKTHEGQDYVFEASCSQQRDSFVNRLKVLVARLASSVIVHDEAMVREFFAPPGAEAFADDLSMCNEDEDVTPPDVEMSVTEAKKIIMEL